MEGYESAGFPTAALDVHIREHQMDYIQPTDVNLCKGRIISDAGGQNEKLKVANAEA